MKNIRILVIDSDSEYAESSRKILEAGVGSCP
jgi:hypothetical protein